MDCEKVAHGHNWDLYRDERPTWVVCCC